MTNLALEVPCLLLCLFRTFNITPGVLENKPLDLRSFSARNKAQHLSVINLRTTQSYAGVPTPITHLAAASCSASGGVRTHSSEKGA